MMQNLSLGQMSTEARSLADRIGSETTEALIRAVSGVQQASSQGAEVALTGAQAVGKEVGHDVAEGARALALPTGSARAAWRTGRVVGRIEGAVKLAMFGVGLWWRVRRRSRHERPEPAIAWRTWARWTPTVIATVWLLVQLWERLRHRD